MDSGGPEVLPMTAPDENAILAQGIPCGKTSSTHPVIQPLWNAASQFMGYGMRFATPADACNR